MAKIKEVEVRVKIYVDVKDTVDSDFSMYALMRHEEDLAEGVAKAINENVPIQDKYGNQKWALLGVNATVEG